MACEGFKLLVSDHFESGRTPVDKRCYGYVVSNKGNTGVKVNDNYLKPYPPGHPEMDGGFFTYTDDDGRILQENVFQIVFDAAPGTLPWLQITQVVKIVL